MTQRELRAQLQQACQRFGITDSATVLSLARDAAVLLPMSEPSGRSRFGGQPELHERTGWPTWRGKSLAFLAQLDLNEMTPVPGLPSNGLLSFFYEPEGNTWGFDPGDRGSWAVRFTESGAPTSIHDWPADLLPEHRYRAAGIQSELAVTLPDTRSRQIDELGLTEEQEDAYFELASSLCEEELWANRGLLGGHPDQFQHDMTEDCALASGGVYDRLAGSDSHVSELLRTANEWQLLLQVPSFEHLGMMWGDAGCLYFWIREEDLRHRRFERSWMILQCG